MIISADTLNELASRLGMSVVEGPAAVRDTETAFVRLFVGSNMATLVLQYPDGRDQARVRQDLAEDADLRFALKPLGAELQVVDASESHLTSLEDESHGVVAVSVGMVVLTLRASRP